MTIDDAIKALKKIRNNGVQNIIIAWWEAGDFDRKDDDEWAEDTAILDDKMDWSSTHEDIDSSLSFTKAMRDYRLDRSADHRRRGN